MRIYNGTKAVVNVPLVNQRISIKPGSVSQNFMPSTDFLKMAAMSFDTDEIALIVAGAFEGNMCANVPAIQPLCVSSLDEALTRFNPAAAKKADPEKKVAEDVPVKEEVKKAEKKLKPVTAEPAPVEEPKPIEEPKPEIEEPKPAEVENSLDEVIENVTAEKPVEEVKPKKKKQPALRKRVLKKDK